MNLERVTTLAGDPRIGSSGIRLPARKRCAFTLVEVTMALGIVAFVMMGLIGVIPAGLNAAQESIQQTAQSHILMQVSSDLGMLPFSDLPAYVGADQYCDYDGRRLDGAANATYQVSMQIAAPDYPNSAQLTNLNRRMERVIVSIRRVGEPATKSKRTPLTVINSGL